MAQGDKVTSLQNIANNGFLDMRPGVGAEWTIHNILYDGSVELYKTDGTNSIKVDSDTTAGGMVSRFFHCTNSVWYQLKNVKGSSAFLSYDGVQSK